MAIVDERARHELYMAVEELIGAERAEVLMSMLPPVGWGDVATKRDLEILESRFAAKLEVLEHRFDAKLERGLREQTRTLMVGLVGSLITMTSVNLTAVALMR